MGFDRINPSAVWKGHLSTLHAHEQTKIRPKDIATFYVLPVVIAVALWVAQPTLSTDFVTASLTGLAILFGFLLNLQMLVVGTLDDLVSKIPVGKPATVEQKLRITLLKETHLNNSYAVMVAFTLIVVLLMQYVHVEYHWPIDVRVLAWIGALSVYTLITHFLLTMLLVVNRVHKALSKQHEMIVADLDERDKKHLESLR